MLSFPILGYSSESEIEALDSQIEALKARLKEERLQEMKEEVEGQEWFVADWEKYQSEVQLIKKKQEEESEIKQQIENLEKRKKELISQPLAK